jgi:protein involved in polysaccharide export with SLBB domain
MNMKILQLERSRAGGTNSVRLASGLRTLAYGLALIFLILASGGCGVKFWDPSQIGRFRPVPAVNVILDSLGVAEETPAAWDTGEEPGPADVVAYETDYVFGPGDIVLINIFELFNEGNMFSSQFVITETGKVMIPDVGVVNAGGLTESQLAEEIKQILAPNILKQPSVSVTLLQSLSRRFSVLGNGVPRPGRYDIPRYDFRLADALATAGGISQFNISYVFVSRSITGQEELAPSSEQQENQQQYAPPVETPASPANRGEPALPPRHGTDENKVVTPPGDEMLEVIAPMAKAKAKNRYVLSSTELVTDEELTEAASPEKISPPANQIRPSAAQNKLSEPPLEGKIEPQGEGRIEWVFQDGRWVPVLIGQPRPTEEAAKPEFESKAPAKIAPPTRPGKEPGQQEGFEKTGTGWEQIGAGGVQRRVIRVSADKLLSGDSRYNIVIQPGDNIHVPVDIIGEFCIMGNVNAQGFINITGRPMTLKMAIASAGGLGPLAWPKRCEVVRRISKKREEIVMVDLDKIAAGVQPDFFIKPNDLINVGTHPTSRYRAVLRNAFRATYGFGFLYDRNFADRDFGTGRPFDFLDIF